MNCPLCGSKPSYVGLSKIECSNPLCDNYPKGAKINIKVKVGWDFGIDWGRLEGTFKSCIAKNMPNKNGDVFMKDNIVVDKFKFADRVFFGNTNLLFTKIPNEEWNILFRPGV